MKTIIVFLSLLIIPSFLYSQTVGGEGSGTTAPVILPQPQQFPQYIVRPKQDLNPYGLSSLGESTVPEESGASTTLGTDRKKKSNIEVNKELLKREEKKARTETEEEVEDFSTDFEAIYDSSESQGESASGPSRKTSIFRWVDKEGIVHVTNDLGAVPKEYIDRVETVD